MEYMRGHVLNQGKSALLAGEILKWVKLFSFERYVNDLEQVGGVRRTRTNCSPRDVILTRNMRRIFPWHATLNVGRQLFRELVKS